ncbi:MAG: hypothetical protein ACRC8S_11780 [Fimbriiglobus sp.]
MNDLILDMVELYYYNGPLTDVNEKDRLIESWIASRTEQDGAKLLKWAIEYKTDINLYQPGDQWQDETRRMAIECAGLVAANLSSDHLRIEIESLLNDMELREDAINGLKQISSEKSLAAISHILDDARYPVVSELSSLLLAIGTAESLNVINAMIEIHKDNSWNLSNINNAKKYFSILNQ